MENIECNKKVIEVYHLNHKSRNRKQKEKEKSEDNFPELKNTDL